MSQYLFTHTRAHTRELVLTQMLAAAPSSSLKVELMETSSSSCINSLSTMYHCQTLLTYTPTHTRCRSSVLFFIYSSAVIALRFSRTQHSVHQRQRRSAERATFHFCQYSSFTSHFFFFLSRREETADQTSSARGQRETGGRVQRSRFVLTGGIRHSLHFNHSLAAVRLFVCMF